MTEQLSPDFVVALYNKYSRDLGRVREYQRKLYSETAGSSIYRFLLRCSPRVMAKFGFPVQDKNRMQPELDDVEAEVTYLLVREFRPHTIVEISPGSGWSTSWILNAIRDNTYGKLWSYDLVDHSTNIVPMDLSRERWDFIKGDIRQNLGKLPKEIDYLFMDSDHSADFACWYLEKIFPQLSDGIVVSVHDVFHTADPSRFDGEGGVVTAWLEQKGIQYFTASPARAPSVYEEILSVKRNLCLWEQIHSSRSNSMIFFVLKR